VTEGLDIGANVRGFRLKAGLSQAELAEYGRTTQETVSAVETSRQSPRPSTLRKIARGFSAWGEWGEVSVRDLYDGPDAFFERKEAAGKVEASQDEEISLTTLREFDVFSGRFLQAGPEGCLPGSGASGLQARR